jgi:hypothetical protein
MRTILESLFPRVERVLQAISNPYSMILKPALGLPDKIQDEKLNLN